MSSRFFSFSYPSCYLLQVIRHSKTSHHINNLNFFKKHNIHGDKRELNGTSFNLEAAKLFVSCNIALNVLEKLLQVVG
uniref:Uncharacterized protein n=1 Tax=Lepeophtheirus salmonis TaxID=72036 RepID=A0A0K2TET7_LEPSM